MHGAIWHRLGTFSALKPVQNANAGTLLYYICFMKPNLCLWVAIVLELPQRFDVFNSLRQLLMPRLPFWIQVRFDWIGAPHSAIVDAKNKLDKWRARSSLNGLLVGLIRGFRQQLKFPTFAHPCGSRGAGILHMVG